MQTEIKKLPKGLSEFSIVVPVEELRPHLEAAAQTLASLSKIEGFRPGHVPYEMVVSRLGEGRIYDAAVDSAVRSAYVRAVKESGAQVIGEPEITIKVLAPGNPLSFTATAPTLPAITKLADYRTVRVPKKEPVVQETDVDRVLGEIQKMQTREAPVDRPAAGTDKVVLSVAMSRDNVPIEGGAAKHHELYLAEPYYIPGFADAVKGLKKGDKKDFTLTFPKEHYQKMLAGKAVDFSVDIESVIELTPPALDDAFAATLGQKSLGDLRMLLRKNLEAEAAMKEEQRQEIAALEALVEGSRFDDIPELMVNNETSRMVAEVEDNILRRGLVFDDYLASIKKSRAELALGFTPQAIRRVKTALVVREVGKKEQIEPTEKDIADEIARQISEYSSDAAAQAEIRKPEHADLVRTMLRNRKVVGFLRGLAVG